MKLTRSNIEWIGEHVRTRLATVGAFVATFVLAGCISTQFSPNNSVGAQPPYQGVVTVLDAFPTDPDYIELGIVLATGGEFASEPRLVDALKEAAAAQGGNAIVLQSKPREGPSARGTAIKAGAFVFRLPDE